MKIIILIFCILIPFLTFTQIIHIPNDYPTIQHGVNAANNGDTVLVDIGTYYENINFNGKNITVASNYLMTLDTSYITQTIIDGNQDGSVVIFEGGEDSTALLIGFTLRNGLAFYSHGGGIRCEDSDPTISFLKLHNNTANGIYSDEWGTGGGIYCKNSSMSLTNVKISGNTSMADFPSGGGFCCQNNCNVLMQNVTISNNTLIKTSGGKHGGGGGISFSSSTITLRNVTITNNYSCHKGGGISGASNSIIVFDTIERSNIYDNIAPIGNDFWILNPESQFIALDTFSVLIPTDYYIESSTNLNYSINYGMNEQIDADLYISPNGSNENSGLTPEDPLQTINYGLSIQLVDSLHPHTMQLLNGTYSASNNNEIYPINLPEGLNLIGESNEGVVLDAEELADVIWVSNNMNSIISDLTITNGYGYFKGGGVTSRNSNLYLNNLVISNNLATGPLGYNGGGIYCYGSVLTIENTAITDNTAMWDAAGGGIANFDSYLFIINSIISDNEALDGGGIYSNGGTNILKNVLISGNTSDWGGGIMASQSALTLINVDIVDNNAIDYEGGGIRTCFSNIDIINSIIRDNTPNEILIPYSMCEDTLTISYSNLKGGINGIINNNFCMVNWLEGNIDEDPMFVGLGDHPYQLNSYSPCIDIGTPDTTGLSLPNTDIVGNKRIWDGDNNGTEIIDMGAYEYGSLPVSIKEPVLTESLNKTELKIFPNPFYQTTTFKLEFKEKSKVTLLVYNQLGEKLKTIFEGKKEKGIYQLTWDSSDISSGIYFIKLQTDKGITTQKIIKK